MPFRTTKMLRLPKSDSNKSTQSDRFRLLNHVCIGNKSPTLVTRASPEPNKSPTLVTRASPEPNKSPTLVTRASPEPNKSPTLVTRALPEPNKSPTLVTRASPEPDCPSAQLTGMSAVATHERQPLQH
ncbi:hypothetical protein OUZ56_027988 [Daphnia magna]|uniref:Uncharacterized protein n=1 Tax=Daphnia magna TaxID=35525 RepID=A0ABR0B2M7_9CRUS|nr:hypothetical protein OUZ56_027988 [Daphnia magna]